ncbi:hypothetical protein HPB49_023003 [Dermacentor silvarum]|uniref:Uncharacterized protein n=1 Tax=Dermacentor silvarum TaxID=543639 RepID=A0ACB8DGD9_DERSI|nr:hypothetical protein HPB49_023003 [Dermacentor silvarum]
MLGLGLRREPAVRKHAGYLVSAIFLKRLAHYGKLICGFGELLASRLSPPQTLAADALHPQSMGLGVANAAPLGMGLLTSSPPPAWHPAAEDLKKACAEAAHFCKEAGYSIERLGLQHSLTKFPGVHTTIVGITSYRARSCAVPQSAVRARPAVLAGIAPRRTADFLGARRGNENRPNKVRFR